MAIEQIVVKIMALLAVPKIGPSSIKKLFALSPNLAFLDQVDPKAWQAELKIPFALGQSIAAELRSDQPKRQLEQELERARRHQTSLIPYNSEAYPPLLREIASPPPILYLKGNPAIFQNFSLGVVGTRKATYHGVRVTKKLLADLAHAVYAQTTDVEPNVLKPLIVSGLAIGIDTHVHLAALENQLPTLAVLANGLASVYPANNAALAERILQQGGALISEQPMATKPLPGFFPLRNRIISGLSQAVLVMEASLKSGSLITARYALEQNREVFALLGPLDAENYAGCVALVDQQKARPITSAASILESLLPLSLKLDPDWQASLGKSAQPIATLARQQPDQATLISPARPASSATAPTSSFSSQVVDSAQLDPDFFFQASLATEEEEGWNLATIEAQPAPTPAAQSTKPAEKNEPAHPLKTSKLKASTDPIPANLPAADLTERIEQGWDPRLWQVFQQNFRCRLEEICSQLGWEASEALALLVQLEILGQIRETEPGLYELSDDVKISR